MAEIINLRRARKDRARSAREKQAEENRARFGRTKAERLQADLEAGQAARHLDGHRRDDSPDAAAGPDSDPPPAIDPERA